MKYGIAHGMLNPIWRAVHVTGPASAPPAGHATRPACSGVLGRSLAVVAALVTAACASGHKSAAPDAALLASIPADVRMIGAESTWVARGVGYELVTRSKVEIAPLMLQLDDQSRFFVKLFGVDPARVIATVRRVGPPGSAPEASAPVPFDAGPVVEIVAPRPTDRVVRAWLSARASALTGNPAPPSAASATADDPRVPAWAEDAIPNLAVPTGREDTTTARLAMQIDSLYPIHTFLTMARPGAGASMARGGANGEGGRGEGGRAGGGGGVGGGGIGGGFGGRRGGMGGAGGMNGGMNGGTSRGGRNGGGNPRANGGGHANAPFSGTALFAAQSLVFGRYLIVREGPVFVGGLVDALIQSKNVSGLFDNAQMVPRNIEQVDIEFHRWLIDRAAHTR
jgi:hypothetical protein